MVWKNGQQETYGTYDLVRNLQVLFARAFVMHMVLTDVIYIHVSLEKHEASSLIKLFVAKIKVPGSNPHILLAATSANLSIDHPNTNMALNLECMEDVATYVQRCGWGSRNGQPPTIILVAEVSAYLRKLTSRMTIMKTTTFPD